MDIIWAIAKNQIGQEFFAGIFRTLQSAIDFRTEHQTDDDRVNLFSGTLPESREKTVALLTEAANQGIYSNEAWCTCWGVANLVKLTTGKDLSDEIRYLSIDQYPFMFNFVKDTVLPLLPDFVFDS